MTIPTKQQSTMTTTKRASKQMFATMPTSKVSQIITNLSPVTQYYPSTIETSATTPSKTSNIAENSEKMRQQQNNRSQSLSLSSSSKKASSDGVAASTMSPILRIISTVFTSSSSSSTSTSSSSSSFLPRRCLSTVIMFMILFLLCSVNNVAARRLPTTPNFALNPPKINPKATIQYKTTYACEQRELHLDCEPDEAIHLVRANYGRFSLNICNEHGRMDLSVMCMSFRSFLIMSDRCANKSNCSVVVSSKLFGDPCPGHAKYLEVQYHCVRGGSSGAVSSSTSPITKQQMPNIPLMSNGTVHHLPKFGSPSVVSSSPSPSSIEHSTPSQIPSAAGSSASSSSSSSSTPSLASQSNLNASIHSQHVPLPSFSTSTPSSSPTVQPTAPTSAYPVPSSASRPPYQSSSAEDTVAHHYPSEQQTRHALTPSSFDATSAHFSPGEYCPSVFMRSLFWNWTRKGDISVLKCPGGAVGNVKWQCQFNPELGVAEWFPLRPDFSECHSLWLDNLEQRLGQDEPVLRTTGDLALLTFTKSLYSDDLQRIARIIQQTIDQAASSIVKISSQDNWRRHEVLRELLTSIVKTISNLLGNAQDDAWLDLSIASRKEVASSLMRSLESSALLLVDNTNIDGSFATAEANVLVSVHALEMRLPFSLQFPTQEDTRPGHSDNNEWTRMEDSLYLPAQSLMDNSLGGFAKVAFFAYYRIEDLLKPSQQTDFENYGLFSKLQNLTHNSGLSINSRVIGAAISKNGRIEHYSLSEPVTVVLRHIQDENLSTPQCVYWNMERQNWLNDGCWVKDTNQTHTVCQCNHLTHFALLSELKTPNQAGDKLHLERPVVLFGSFLAVLILALVTILICMTPSGSTVSSSIHRHLCFSLFCAELLFGIFFYWLSDSSIMNISLPMLHYFLTCTFFWTFFESFDVYMNMNSIYENFKSSRRLYWYYLISYVSPLLFSLVCFLIDPNCYRNFPTSWLRVDNYLYLVLFGPSIVLILGSLVFIMFAYLLTRNHVITTTTIKCFEDIRVGSSKSLIRWTLLFSVFQAFTWSTAFAFLFNQESLFLAIFFVISNIIISLFVAAFCLRKLENVQHSFFFRHLPFSLCNDESQLPSTKNSTTSDVYSTRPVVTQVTTQVNGIIAAAHHHHHHSPSTPTATSPMSMSPCLGPNGQQTHPLPISQSAHWTFQQSMDEHSARNNMSIRPDLQSILHPEHSFNSPNYRQQGNFTKTLPREFYGQGESFDNPAAYPATTKRKFKQQQQQQQQLQEFASLHRNLNSIRQKSGENKYAIQGNYAPNLDHIYECIDSESGASVFYDPARRMHIQSFYGPTGVAYHRSKSTVAEDDLSSSSIYEDKPLLNQSRGFIYDKKPELMDSSSAQIHHQATVEPMWHQFSGKESDLLPDLIQQKQNQANNLLVSYNGDNNRFLNKVINHTGAQNKNQE